MIKGLLFDEARHQFFYKGELIPSVTHVLKDLGFFGGNSRFWTEEGRDRGSAIADAIDMDVRGTLDKGAFARERGDNWVPFFDGYKAWRHECRIKKVYGSEIVVFNRKLSYAGIADLKVMFQNKSTIVEVKSGSKESWHGIQLQGYAQTWARPQQTYLLYLTKKGTYKFLPSTEPPETWRHLMWVYRRKHGSS